MQAVVQEWDSQASFRTIPAQDADLAECARMLGIKGFFRELAFACELLETIFFLIPKFSLQELLNKCMLHYSHYSIMTVFPPAF